MMVKAHGSCRSFRRTIFEGFGCFCFLKGGTLLRKNHTWNLCSVYRNKLNQEYSIYVLFKMISIECNLSFTRIMLFWGLIDIYSDKEK